MKSSLSLTCFFILVVLLSGCKTRPAEVLPVVDLEPIATAVMLDSVFKALPYYETMSFRARVNLKTSKDNQNFTLNLRSKNDSIVWATITGPLGYEVARVMVTKDSIKVIDRPNRQFTQRPFDYIEQFIPVSADLELITKVLSGNFLFKDDRRGDWESGVDDRYYRLSYKSDLMEGFYWIHPENFSIQQANVIDLVSNRGMLVKLDDYRKIQDRWVPFEREIEFPGENASMKFSINRITFGEDLTFPFNVSDNFERVE